LRFPMRFNSGRPKRQVSGIFPEIFPADDRCGNNELCERYIRRFLLPQVERPQMQTSAQAIDWSSIIEGNRSWIERLVAARTGSPSGIDDVMQEASLAVARSSDRPACPDEGAPWLRKIGVWECSLFVRNQARHQRKLDGFQQDRLSQASPTADPILWLLHEEQKEIVRGELAKLDARSRQLLIWKYVQRLRYDDIGTRLGVTRHVAEYRVIEARKQLRRRLQARGIEGGES
jgi:RNA polymerase sigma factor (sigma-70 family)